MVVSLVVRWFLTLFNDRLCRVVLSLSVSLSVWVTVVFALCVCDRLDVTIWAMLACAIRLDVVVLVRWCFSLASGSLSRLIIWRLVPVMYRLR